MNGCEAIRENLCEWLDDELTAELRAGVDAHLRQCAECRAELEALRAASGAVHALPALKAPASLLPRIREQVKAEAAAASHEQAPEPVIRAGEAFQRKAQAPWTRGLVSLAAFLAMGVLVYTAITPHVPSDSAYSPQSSTNHEAKSVKEPAAKEVAPLADRSANADAVPAQGKVAAKEEDRRNQDRERADANALSDAKNPAAPPAPEKTAGLEAYDESEKPAKDLNRKDSKERGTDQLKQASGHGGGAGAAGPNAGAQRDGEMDAPAEANFKKVEAEGAPRQQQEQAAAAKATEDYARATPERKNAPLAQENQQGAQKEKEQSVATNGARKNEAENLEEKAAPPALKAPKAGKADKTARSEEKALQPVPAPKPAEPAEPAAKPETREGVALVTPAATAPAAPSPTPADGKDPAKMRRGLKDGVEEDGFAKAAEEESHDKLVEQNKREAEKPIEAILQDQKKEDLAKSLEPSKSNAPGNDMAQAELRKAAEEDKVKALADLDAARNHVTEGPLRLRVSAARWQAFTRDLNARSLASGGRLEQAGKMPDRSVRTKGLDDQPKKPAMASAEAGKVQHLTVRVPAARKDAFVASLQQWSVRYRAAGDEKAELAKEVEKKSKAPEGEYAGQPNESQPGVMAENKPETLSGGAAGAKGEAKADPRTEAKSEPKADNPEADFVVLEILVEIEP